MKLVLNEAWGFCQGGNINRPIEPGEIATFELDACMSITAHKSRMLLTIITVVGTMIQIKIQPNAQDKNLEWNRAMGFLGFEFDAAHILEEGKEKAGEDEDQGEGDDPAGNGGQQASTGTEGAGTSKESGEGDDPAGDPAGGGLSTEGKVDENVDPLAERGGLLPS